MKVLKNGRKEEKKRKDNVVRRATSLRRNGCSLYNKLKGNIFTVVCFEISRSFAMKRETRTMDVLLVKLISCPCRLTSCPYPLSTCWNYIFLPCKVYRKRKKNATSFRRFWTAEPWFPRFFFSFSKPNPKVVTRLQRVA